MSVLADGSGGVVLDGQGAVHPFGIGGLPPAVSLAGPYWSGWDIARGVAILDDRPA